MDERLHKSDKYCETIPPKKQRRSESVINDRAGTLNLKMGTQIYSINQRVEDRPKNILLNKRVRTSVAESRAECQSNNGLQRQPVTMAKDASLLEENGEKSDLFERIHRLTAGGEGWDKKIKRKRSVGTVFPRSIESDGVAKRALQNKVVDEHGSQARDAHMYRLNNPVTKIKGSRTARSGGSMVASSPPMAHWAGQRPQKMARPTRPNQDQNQLSFDTRPPSDVGPRLPFNGTNGFPVSKNATNGPQNLIVKLNTVQSSPRLSEIKESVGCGNRLDNAATPKPFQSSTPGCKKNGSKPGHRLKKLSDRGGFSHTAPLQNCSSPDVVRASNDDREELLAAAKHARVASHLACSSAFWKKMEPVFAPVSSEDKSFLFQQAGHLHQDSVSNESGSFSRRHELNKTSNGSIPLYQRVLSAFIVEDDIDSLEERDARNMLCQNTFCGSAYNSNHINGSINSSTSPIINNISSDVRSEAELLGGISYGPQMLLHSDGLNDRLLFELQSIGLCTDTTDTLPGLNDKENEAIQREVDNLKTRLRQQEVKKKAYLEKICKAVETDPGVRDCETVAMDRLVELANRKLLEANRRRSRSGIHKVPKHVALAFGKRTLARCRKFEKSGTSCFNVPPYQDILFGPSEIESDPTAHVNWSDEAFAINGPTSNRGKKKEVLLDDVGTSVIRGSGAKGKRSSAYGRRKIKPRQKTGQLSGQLPTAANGTRQVVNTRIDVRFASQGRKNRNDPTNMALDELDSLDELGVGGGGAHDLTSMFNFEEPELEEEEDFVGGLHIPMDDLTQLNF